MLALEQARSSVSSVELSSGTDLLSAFPARMAVRIRHGNSLAEAGLGHNNTLYYGLCEVKAVRNAGIHEKPMLCHEKIFVTDPPCF